jgi:hypothetical protein
MNKTLMTVIVSAAVILLGSLTFVGWGISLNNQEVSLRTSVEAKMKDNKQQLANMKNKFRETGQVSSKEVELLSQVFVNYANARSGNGGGNLATFVTEAVPNVKAETLTRLMNVIEAGRNSWTSRQTELIDIHRAHTELLRKFPGNILFSILGRKELEITVVSSEEAERAFESGKEEATKLF